MVDVGPCSNQGCDLSTSHSSGICVHCRTLKCHVCGNQFIQSCKSDLTYHTTCAPFVKKMVARGEITTQQLKTKVPFYAS